MKEAEQRMSGKRAGKAEAGGKVGLGEVLPQVYEELRQVAAVYLGRERPDHTLQPTALVHEAFLKLADQTGIHWKDQTHFCALAAGAMRQILVDHARKKAAAKRGGDLLRVTFHEEASAARPLELDLVALDEALVSCPEKKRNM